MDTMKFNAGRKPQMIAHRGVSGLEMENTAAAFVAAGNRSYFGIETDVHRTKDGKYVIIHDDSTARVAGKDLTVEQTDYETLRNLLLRQTDGRFGRTDIRIPSLEEYISICRHYEKTAVLELKNHFSREDVLEICSIIEKLDYLEHVIFISFDYDNLVSVRSRYPHQPVQFLTGACDRKLVEKLARDGMDLDVQYQTVTPELAAYCREKGVKINCWTVNEAEKAAELAEMGVAFITSNILE